ncbi:uncharacterized protein LOC123259682 [Cotesia glomerata]|uniref:uncharacterized protein LOC123259682 n=1 Tax=Cotesia glomerata TaxID=32391 RepID=UPI001D0066F5|nr:uncharacterized protein LOC123259682 [Cotesia glomerata]
MSIVLSQSLSTRLSNLKVCHVNAQSLRNEFHFEIFKEYFRNHNYDIIAVSETWLNRLIPDNMVSLPHHTLYRHDHHLRSGGGVSLYVRNNIKAKYVASSVNSEEKHPEYLFVEILSSSQQKILVGVVYKPPNIGHLDDLEEEMENIMVPFNNIIIVGHLNSDLSKKNFYGDQLRKFCDCLYLHIVEYAPTHHLQNLDSWIDVCIVDDLSKVLASEQSSDPFISDHDLISVTYNYKVELQQLNSFTFRNWNAIDDDKLRELCKDIDYEALKELSSVDEMNTCLHAHLERIINAIAPEKLVVPRRPPATWFTDDIRSLQCRRNKLYRIYRRTGYAYKEYSNVRRLVKKRITEAKKKYFDNQLINAKNSREL